MTKPDDIATAVQTPSEAGEALRAAERRADVRFTPGTILLDRYRVISLLGRGGMGEVYRAEDMKLGQQVALKFVPRELGRDPGILKHLYSEVRIGRDVAHPNVCRLYDIVEFDGDHFIAMQYVDGEDLASLLRRIGRLPAEKAIDIARDLCAGLAAAHDRGVIHRDLKPANVMIDGKGRAHVTDFGLAVLTGDAQKRGIAGTPVYMAPEQLSGDRVTTASDVYALGLILYEILTGRRMFDGASVTQIAQQHLQSKPRLSSIVRDVPAPVEAIVMQCLAEEPDERPRSARAVLAALPGGDPLAAAVAAGETPSPEMVAAAAKTGEMSAPIAGAAAVAFIAMILGIAALAPKTTLFSSARLRKTPDTLGDRAEEVVHAAGVAGDPEDAGGFFIDRHREFRKNIADRDRLAYVYRRGAVPQTPQNIATILRMDDPPLLHPRSATVQLASDGRLLSLAIVPDETQHAAPQAIDDLFRAAGYDRAAFHAVPPSVAPPVGSDQRMAWDGAAHIEAASYRGGVTWFAVNPLELAPPTMLVAGVGGLIYTILFLVLLAVAVAMAVMNLRRGRTDFRGGLRAAIFAFVATLIALTLNAHFTRVSVGVHISNLLAAAAFDNVIFFTTYLASEPYVRRYWPTALISWQRLIDGQWRDSLVARDLALGLLIGAISALKTRVLIVLAGTGVPSTPQGLLAALGSGGRAMAWVFHVPGEALGYGLGAMFFILLARIYVKRPWIYLPLFAAMLGVAMAPNTSSNAVNVAAGLIGAVLVIYTLHAGGLLMISAAWAAYHLFEGLPLTLDATQWYSMPATWTAVVLIAVVTYACYLTLPRGRTLASVPSTT